jgi:hypothetical protein
MRALAGLTVIAFAVVVSPVAARAGERVTDAALGAIAGAVAAGPVGLVGGGIIGYAAGPQIACDLGAKRCYRRVRYRHSTHSAPDALPHTTDRSDDGHAGRSDIGKRQDHGNY